MAAEDQWDSTDKVVSLRSLIRSPDINIPSYLSDDEPLLKRFLRARKGDCAKALELLKAHSEWRKTACPNWPNSTIEYSLVADECNSGKAWCFGSDRKGRPLAWVIVSKHLATTDRKVIRDFTIFLIDEIIARCDASGIEQGSIVIDLNGFSTANSDVDAGGYMIECLSANYPERMGRMLFLRESWLFGLAWKVISLFVDSRTANKISFLGHSFRDKLLEEIDDEFIPTWLGGKSSYVYDPRHIKDISGPNPYLSVTRSNKASSSGAASQ